MSTMPADLNAKERARSAWRLRCMGYDLPTIAKRLGYASKSGPAMAIKAYIKTIDTETREEMRVMVGQRLDMLTSAFTPTALRHKKPNPFHADIILKATDQTRKLFGLDMPTEAEAMVTDGRTKVIVRHSTPPASEVSDASN